MQYQDIPSTGYLRQSKLVGAVIPVGSMTLWPWVKEGKFPKPTKLSGRGTVRRVEELCAWMGQQQVAA
jgi:prophage regulatory protein